MALLFAANSDYHRFALQLKGVAIQPNNVQLSLIKKFEREENTRRRLQSAIVSRNDVPFARNI